jgi:hypothetical protein
MSKTLTFELPDEIYEALEQMAAKSGRPTEELALEWLARHGPKSCSRARTEDLEVAWARLRRHAGAGNSGDPRSADNERIDADLTRGYSSTHEDPG